MQEPILFDLDAEILALQSIEEQDMTSQTRLGPEYANLHTSGLRKSKQFKEIE